MTIPCAGTFLLIFNNSLWESADLTPTSTASWTQEPFPATGAPKGATALGTGAGVAGWVLDGTSLPAPLWRRVDQNTFVTLNVTSDFSPTYLDFYTVPFLFPPSGGGFNVVGDIGVPSGQSQQMYVQSMDAGLTAPTFSYGNLPTSGNTLMRFWADERQLNYPASGFFLAQIRQQPSGSDFLYGGILPNSWNLSPILQTGSPVSGGSVQDIRADFIRKQNGTFLVSIHQAPTGNIAIVRSTGGGWTVASFPANSVPNPGLVECDDGTVLVPNGGPGNPGFVFRSTDDGQTFQSTLTISGVTSAQVWLKYFPAIDMLFAYVLKQGGSAPFGTAVYLSTDQGKSWTQVFAQTLAVGLGPQVTSWMALTGGTRSSVKQLLGANTGCNIFSPQTAPVIAKLPPVPGSASAPYLGQFFFYSNNPEPASLGLADNNKFWLLRETVTGSGRVFFWHGNNVSAKLNSELLVYNPNSFSITVTATGGAVPLNGNGVDAWFALFNGIAAAGSPLKISPGQFGTLFVQTGLPFSRSTALAFGVVANLNITDPNNQPAQATLFDVAWTSKFDPATLNASGQQAPNDNSNRVRGLAAVPPNNYGYWIPVILNPFSINSIITPPGSTQGFTVAGAPNGTNDAFNGTDAPLITDPASTPANPIVNPLLGDYGVQLCFTWPIHNDTGVTHTVTFYAGSSQNLGGPTNFAIYYTGPGGCSGSFSGLNTNQYLAFLQDMIAPNTTVTYKFQIVTIGQFTYPLTVWVGVS
jgi:hypothetical protein